MEVQVKNNLVGFLWQKIPVLSQYLLARDENNSSFEHWCEEEIDKYHKNYEKLFNETKKDIKHFESIGCCKVVVCPEPVGKTRSMLFKRFLDEIPENTFVLVESFDSFGHGSNLKLCIDLALEKNVFLITEKHLSMLSMPLEILPDVYHNWIYNFPIQKRNTRHTRNQANKASLLIESGMTCKEVQKELGISKSTIYRYLQNNA